MTTYIKYLLERTGVYGYLRYSLLFNIYQMLFNPAAIARHRKEVRLYKKILGHCNLIFDIGAYDGHKTAAFSEISDKIISCEPDTHNFKLLVSRFRNQRKKVELLNVAVFDKERMMVLNRNAAGSAFNTLNPEWINILENDEMKRWNEKIKFDNRQSIEVRTTTLNELIKKYGIPDFIKIDVEGSEKEVMQGLDTTIKSLSFECLLPEFQSHLLFILDKLISADNKYQFNVIYEEELLLNQFVNYDEIIQWTRETDLFSFDIVAKLNDPDEV